MLRMKRIGILGGTFNPIHIAHLIIAEEVRQQLRLDKILFIPSANPPHKSTGDIIDAKIRLKLIDIAIKSSEYFKSSDIEIKNTHYSKSYTVNTLEMLNKQYRGKGIKFFLLIGLDSFIELDTWKEPQRLFELADVVVLNRESYSERKAENEFTKKVKFITVPNLEISSTDIRKRIKEKRTIRYLVPSGVEEYILENGLYK